MKLYYRLGTALVLALGVLIFVPMTSAQPPVPHFVEDRDDCLLCHQSGAGGAPQVAADHEGRTNETCGVCHAPTGVEPGTVPTIPHPTEGREACLVCHEDGLGGATKTPDDHAERTDETCDLCHAAAGAGPAPVSPGALTLPLLPHPAEGQE